MPPTASPTTPSADRATWTAFLVIAFGVVGMIGAFATFAGQIPFDRAMVRIHAIDRAVAASHKPQDAAADAELRTLLDDSADRVLKGDGTVEARAAAERQRVLEDFYAESKDYGFRLRVVIVAFTAAAALFGAMILSIARR
jgi:cytochrome c-type biogenesis protein CcmH/NrfG